MNSDLPHFFWNYTSFYRYNARMKQPLYLLIIPLFFAACTPKPSLELASLSSGAYAKSSFDELPSWESENYTNALKVFQKTCTSTKANGLLKRTCEGAKTVSPEDVQKIKTFFEQNFTPFISLSNRSLATGYYEPFLEGSLEQTPLYPYPIYGVPDDLLKIELSEGYRQYLKKPLRGRLVDGVIKPYFTRQEITSEGLITQKPICYVNDKIQLFFLQVQGSGKVYLDDNSSLYIGYADQNGHPYVSIGKEMIKRGLIKQEDISLESICNYLQQYPYEADEILNLNPSYIFFEKRQQSATGALGVVLEAGRSVAVDKSKIPLGMPLFISTREPLSGDKYEKMMFAHDTGGAIKGESRIDIFFGSGEKARKQAGLMQDEVKLWMLVPNDYLQNSK